MQRTQISLTADERRTLDRVAARTGRSISALIRDAVEKVYGSERNADEDLAMMGEAFGAWADRDDDKTGEQVVEELRSSSRLGG